MAIIREQRKYEVVALQLRELKELLVTAARMGAQEIRRYDDPARDRLSQTTAYKMFGRARVEKWYRENIVHKVFINDRAYYSMNELQAADLSEHVIPEVACHEFYMHQQAKRERREQRQRNAAADPYGGFTFGGERKLPEK